MTILKFAGRTLAMLCGIVGAIVALLVTIVSVGGKYLSYAVNPASTATSHGFLGTLCFLVGLIGGLIAIPFPSAAALLMLVAGLGMIYVAGAGAIIGAPLLIIGAILAFLDRKKESAKTA